MDELFGAATKLFSNTPKRKEENDSSSGSDGNGGKKVAAATPKMDVLFTSNPDVTTGYYGSLKFLDNQNEFDAIFGKNPVLLPSNPTSSNNTTTAKLLLDFSDQCRLDVYMYACRKFYVGTAKVDKHTSIMEVYREISSLCQEYRDNHGKMITNTPEELFTKFLALSGSLPDCARGWLIQLCSTYYTSLSNTITDRMMSNATYTSPSLVGLNTKVTQLEALQIMQEGEIF